MTKWNAEGVVGIIINPFYAINVDPIFAEPHTPLVTEEEWIVANAKAIHELGADGYLRRLLQVLKGQAPQLEPNR